MALFSFNFELEKFFPGGIKDEKLALDMISAGQEVMQKNIQNAARKHVRTGSMANSVKCSKPLIDKNGDAVGRVKFYGTDEAGMLNWYKAIWIEYGTVSQPARPFIRPAIRGSEISIKAAMQRVFDKKVKK